MKQMKNITFVCPDKTMVRQNFHHKIQAFIGLEGFTIGKKHPSLVAIGHHAHDIVRMSQNVKQFFRFIFFFILQII